MADFTLWDVYWCTEHAHPYVVLHTSRHDHHLAAPISVEDARALAQEPSPTGSIRAFRVMETLMDHLQVRLDSVELHVGMTEPFVGVRAHLHLVQGDTQLMVPACLADGLTLAHLRQARVWMSDHQLRHYGDPHETPGSIREQEVPSFFQDLIESLDMRGIGPPDPWPDRTECL